jgi:hypothetical protein
MMREAAEKAIQLDPLLAEAHEALGAVQAGDAEWAQSEKSFRRSLELDSNNSKSHDVWVLPKCQYRLARSPAEDQRESIVRNAIPGLVRKS